MILLKKSMAYVDLRPYKPKKKKTALEDTNADTSASVGSDTNVESDFFSNLAGIGDTSASTSASQGFSSTIVSSKDDVIEILNLLHEKLSKIEDKIYRMERKLDNIDKNEKNHSTYDD